jgi:Xaa-Pro aminopeptidase
MSTYTVARRVGRLIEVRHFTTMSAQDLDAFHARMLELINEQKGRVVSCVDFSRVRIFSPENADRIRSTMRLLNPSIERSAILLAPENATICLQMERLVRDAASPSRRSFREAGAAIAWLREVLSPEELARLREFVSESALGAGASPASSP